MSNDSLKIGDLVTSCQVSVFHFGYNIYGKYTSPCAWRPDSVGVITSFFENDGHKSPVVLWNGNERVLGYKYVKIFQHD